MFASSSSRRGSNMSEYMWRLVNFKQMDFSRAMSELCYLIVSPSEVIKTARFRRMTRNQWARDDPAFMVLTMYFISVASLAYTAAFGVFGMGHFLRLVVGQVLIEYLGCGIIISTILWWLINKFMISRGVMVESGKVEWMYCFDVHCNSFFPFFVLLYVVQYFLTPILLSDHFISLLLGNCLYAFSFAYYIYLSFLGYGVLPFIHDAGRMLLPIGGVAILLVLSLLTQFNICRFVLSRYF